MLQNRTGQDSICIQWPLSCLYLPSRFNWYWSNVIGSFRCLILTPTLLAAASWTSFMSSSRPSSANTCCRATQQHTASRIHAHHCHSVSGHIARMDDDADAKMILMAPPPDNWKRPLGRPRITWLNTAQWDLRAYNLTLNEAVDLAQNRPLWRLMSTCSTTRY